MQRLSAVITCDTRMLLCISYSFLSSYFTGPKLSVVSWWTWKASPAIWNLHICCHRYIFSKDIGNSCVTRQEKGDCWKLAAFWDLSHQRYKVDGLISYVYGLWPCSVVQYWYLYRLCTWATEIKFTLDLRVPKCQLLNLHKTDQWCEWNMSFKWHNNGHKNGHTLFCILY